MDHRGVDAFVGHGRVPAASDGVVCIPRAEWPDQRVSREESRAVVLEGLPVPILRPFADVLLAMAGP